MMCKVMLILGLCIIMECYYCVKSSILMDVFRNHRDNEMMSTTEGTDYDPDEHLTCPEIIKRYGYSAETHIVKTEDGYLLHVHRISADRNGSKGVRPILLQHGLLGSSDDWVTSKNNSLAFILADLGYDVWLGNARGNVYSKAHVSLDPSSAQFWNFSFHEMGIFDLPAVVNHIVHLTGMEGQLLYVGHSMGTTMFFVFASSRSDVATRQVKAMVSLAPVAYLTHIESPIRYFAPFIMDIEWVARVLGIRDFLPKGKIMDLLTYECKMMSRMGKLVCENVLFAICGFDEDEFDSNLLNVVLSHSPAGSSVKTVVHYGQEIHHGGNFMQFDYGKDGNLRQYGNVLPPSYNLEEIRVPIFLMYADNDWLSDPTDVSKLSGKLDSVIGVYRVPREMFNHLDFLWGKDAKELVYKTLIQVIERYFLSDT